MGITIQSNSTLTVIIHLITLEASWFNVFWFTSSVLDFGLLLLLYSSCVFHHYQQRSTVRIALPCTPRTCLLHLNSPLPTILKGWTYPRVCPKGTVTEKTEPCINLLMDGNIVIDKQSKLISSLSTALPYFTFQGNYKFDQNHYALFL